MSAVNLCHPKTSRYLAYFSRKVDFYYYYRRLRGKWERRKVKEPPFTLSFVQKFTQGRRDRSRVSC